MLFSCQPASAIIVADYDIAEAPPADEISGDWDINWDYTYRYKRSSAVAVAPYWLLTAAHVADDNVASNVVVNGTNYIPQEIVFHFPDHDPDNNQMADLALVRFDKEFPGYYPLYDGGFPSADPQKLSAVLIGYGRTGTVHSSHYNEYSGGNGTKRWGTQRIDGTDTRSYNIVDSRESPPVTNATQNLGIEMEFSLGDTPYEAGVGIYDSGGGTFVKDGGTWKVAGINTTRYGTAPDFEGVFAVSVPAYLTWINNVITPTSDLDGDGIPNYWEQQYSGSITGLVASADNDADGLTNYEEYIADTDPTDDTSFPRFDGVAMTEAHELYFTGSTARHYQIFHVISLTDTNLTWTASHTNAIWGAGTNTVIIVTNEVDRVYYRLRVTLP